MFVGAPGIGKTAHIKSCFDYAEIMLTPTLVEEDIGGLPYREGNHDYRTVPSMFRRLAEVDAVGKTTVLFLDELDKSRRSVADTLLTLIVSRAIGQSVLPANTCIVAAANPPEFGGGDGISDAMLSRFAVIECEPDVAQWCQWATNNFQKKSFPRVIQAVSRGELPIFEMVGEGLNKRISSPRTIAMALNAAAMFPAESYELEQIVKGLLTPATATQFLYLIRSTENEVLDLSINLIKRSNIKKAVIQPVRL